VDTVHECDGRTDGRTDRRTDGQNYDHKDRIASHGKNGWTHLHDLAYMPQTTRIHPIKDVPGIARVEMSVRLFVRLPVCHTLALYHNIRHFFTNRLNRELEDTSFF